MYVAASHCDQVELFLNGKSLGVAKQPCDFVDTFNGGNRNMGDTGYIYAFTNIAFAPGTLKAVATKGGKIVAQQELQTAGEPEGHQAHLHTGPKGLQADGSDVALIDFEVVDAQGRRCPTDEARVDFDTSAAPSSGAADSTPRSSTRPTTNISTPNAASTASPSARPLTPGTITITAKRDGLAPGTIEIKSVPVEISDGLSR